ncbi:MAG: hypothetical protein CFE34_15150 [Rhodobacteraceae bacterium PARR1]|nr:MAG: hypothetical protein CFE34_15150 [Rhodobacteraceae bacterium PARR1]
MKLPAATCLTCRMIRRFLLAFLLGGVLAWQITGANPFHPGSGVPMDGLLIVAVIFAFLSVFMRMREMRARFRRRG